MFFSICDHLKLLSNRKFSISFKMTWLMENGNCSVIFSKVRFILHTFCIKHKFTLLDTHVPCRLKMDIFEHICLNSDERLPKNHRSQV